MAMTRWVLFAGGLLVACSNDNPSNPSTDPTGGKQQSGGASSRAGATGLGGRVGAGGTSADGDTRAVAGKSPIADGAAAGEPNTSLAGATATGGVTGASGMTSSAGNGGDTSSVAGAPITATGGAGNGGAAGRNASIGGTSAAVAGAAAGATATTKGGNLSVGGASSIGGVVSTGGTVPLGGTVSTGGTTATDGCTGPLQTVQEATGRCVATMVPIPGPTTATNYNIDSTEVTRKQYAMWLATTNAATLSAQDSATCGWNTDFAPSSSCMTSSHVCMTNCDNHPQVCVDWCDAYAYCKGVGKRLCGRIGGGPNQFADYASASLSAWYRACSSGGSFTYPYANTYSGATCNGFDYWGSPSTYTTLAVGTLSGCQAAAPYDGAYDLSGNVWEWEDSCDSTTAGESANCRVRGGSFHDVSPYLVCGYGVGSRNTVLDSAGLRCCSP
jgi:formylglycine-generating enzyme